jgi:hypothetical protein
MQEIFFTILVIWILFRLLGRASATSSTTYTFTQNNYQKQEEEKKKDDVKIDYIPGKGEKKKGGDEGEYTDYEEIK